jgi:hypothetical protein
VPPKEIKMAWVHQSEMRGFTALLHDISQMENGRLASLHRRHDAEASAEELAADIREGGAMTVKAFAELSAPLARIAKSFGDMSKRLEADARANDVQRRADARAQLATFNEEVLTSIAAGLINGVEGAKLDGLIHRMAMRLGEP